MRVRVRMRARVRVHSNFVPSDKCVEHPRTHAVFPIECEVHPFRVKTNWFDAHVWFARLPPGRHAVQAASQEGTVLHAPEAAAGDSSYPYVSNFSPLLCCTLGDVKTQPKSV
jgi:hypothetical protein